MDPYLDSDEVATKMINAYKVAVKSSYKFGVHVRRGMKEVLRLDKEQDQTLWRDAIDKELAEINKSIQDLLCA